ILGRSHYDPPDANASAAPCTAAAPLSTRRAALPRPERSQTFTEAYREGRDKYAVGMQRPQVEDNVNDYGRLFDDPPPDGDDNELDEEKLKAIMADLGVEDDDENEEQESAPRTIRAVCGTCSHVQEVKPAQSRAVDSARHRAGG